MNNELPSAELSSAELTLADLRAALRDHFADGAAPAEARAIVDGVAPGFDRQRWQVISSALGVGALTVGQSHGGLGLGLRHACAAVEIAGEHLCPSPVRATLLVAQVLTDAVAASAVPADHPAARWCEDIVSQAASGTLVVDTDPRCRDVLRLQSPIDTRPGVVGRVSGTLTMVENGIAADHLLVWADDDSGGGALVGVELTGEPAATRTPLRATDVTGGFARIDLDRCPAVILGGRAAADRATQQALVLRAAEQIGLARACLTMAVEHARVRTQFGRIIGTYQAISHRLAQDAVDIEGAAALVGMACAGDTDPGRLDALAPLAAASAARVSGAAADTLIQVLGGIGFTWEHNAQLYFRRIKSLAVWMGSADTLDDHAARRGCHRLLRA